MHGRRRKQEREKEMQLDDVLTPIAGEEMPGSQVSDPFSTLALALSLPTNFLPSSGLK